MPSPIIKGKEIRDRAGEKLRDLDHGDLSKSGFWVSQMFVVVATIIGVYLAANAGLEQAITFDRLISQESNYYLRKSLHDEVADNVSVLRTYANDTLSRNLHQSDLVNYTPVLSRYVWETMRYSPHTLEMPSTLLSGARRFVIEADEIIKKAEGWIYSGNQSAKQMNELLDQVEAELLPGLRQNYENLADELAEQGVNVTVLKETE